MDRLIKILSWLIILLGLVHTGFAFPIRMDTRTLWFTGAGMAIIFAGLLNFVAIDRGGSRFTLLVAMLVNGLNCALFCWALFILNQPQVYVGIAITLAATLAFGVKYGTARI